MIEWHRVIPLLQSLDDRAATGPWALPRAEEMPPLQGFIIENVPCPNGTYSIAPGEALGTWFSLLRPSRVRAGRANLMRTPQKCGCTG